MATYDEKRTKSDIYIKEKSQRRTKTFFITSSAKMDEDDGINKTTISSSVFTEMSKSFSDGEYLTDDAIREPNAGILYMLQEMQHDIDDLYNEAEASAFESSWFPFAHTDTGSFDFVASDIIPDVDNDFDIGTDEKAYKTIYFQTMSIGGAVFNSSSIAAGDKGDKGDTGATGATGARGATGAAGAKGDKGMKGKKGDPISGWTFTAGTGGNASKLYITNGKKTWTLTGGS